MANRIVPLNDTACKIISTALEVGEKQGMTRDEALRLAFGLAEELGQATMRCEPTYFGWDMPTWKLAFAWAGEPLPPYRMLDRGLMSPWLEVRTQWLEAGGYPTGPSVHSKIGPRKREAK